MLVLQACVGRAEHETVDRRVTQHDVGDNLAFVDLLLVLGLVQLQVEDGEYHKVFHVFVFVATLFLGTFLATIFSGAISPINI